MNILIISLTPVFIILFYIYFRDKYEKEPWKLLLKTLIAGGLISIPAVFLESFLGVFSPPGGLLKAAFDAFAIAGFVEEGLKYSVFLLLIWKNKEFSEKFDGIVYAVFISLGFAGVENVLYVSGDISIGISRALTAVPAHALFGVTMGYYYGLARFFPLKKNQYLKKALFWPVLLHGFYDFCLMSGYPLLFLLFIPFVVYLWISGFRKMKDLSDRSIFRIK